VRTFPNENELYGRARELGRELCAPVDEKREFPEQEAFRQSFRARMQRVVGYMQDFWPYEREYWREKK